MCGIVGIYHREQNIVPALLDRARDALAHRGPDGKGSWISKEERVGLAHRRLSIVDVHGGAQPLFNQDRTLCTSVNGEFYGYSTLRTDLEAKGHVFTSRSDSELVLHLYQEYDLNFVQHLRGEFAFILYDQIKKRMLAVRDRFGIKPLCYAYKEGSLYLASEAKALFHLGIQPAWNERALYQALSFQYLPRDNTLFQGIEQVAPGHMLVFDGTNLNNVRYWDLSYPDQTEETASEQEISEQLDMELREALRLRLELEDTPVCCHLSGGVDSATVAALGSRLRGQALPCFSVSFPHQNYDELDFAQTFAKKIGAPFHPVFVGAQEMVDSLADAVYHSEGLAINNHLSAKYILNREIKKAGFKVALTGEGSDELFAGYLHLRADYAPQNTEHDLAVGIHLSKDKTFPLDSLEKELGFIPNFIKAKAAIGYKMQALLNPSPFGSEDVVQDILSHKERYQGSHPVNQSSYLWIKYALSGYILKTLGDGCEMAHGIEGRVPFLDHSLFELSKNIPLSMKIGKTQDKQILRTTVKNYLTPELLQRKKQPFIAPPFSLLADSKGYEFLRDQLHSCSNIPLVHPKKLSRYLDAVPQKPWAEQVAAEPVLMLLLTASLLGQRYSLCAP